ncbi:MAG TPA: zinc-dependent metalloprotease family protein [Pseudolysinimonas sp.]
MSASPRFRLSALFAGVAVIAATLIPAFPAAADDLPAPEPTSAAQLVETPTPDATPSAEPTADPAPDVTPDATPSVDPTPNPTSTATAPVPQTVSFRGVLNRISDEEGGATPTLVLMVDGYGSLLIDGASLPQANRSGKITANVVVPEGLTLSDDESAQFAQLANYSTTVAPLKLASTVGQRGIPKQEVGQLVTTTPVSTGLHKVYVVLVSPKERQTKGSNQTTAEASALVANADSYWSAQSGGQIDFSLGGTAAWYASSYSCKTDAGTVALWNQAAAVAKSKIGYVAGANAHLVLLFPYNTDCGGSIGEGTIGWSVNQGGMSWIVGGSNQAIREGTLAHELGHNLSLGHADWLDCSSATPVVGTSAVNYASDFVPDASIDNCTVNHYGDFVDVMGFGDDGKTGGSLSSPNAIRSGIWPSGAWVNAPIGTNTYVLNSVSSDSGLRSIVLQDDDGTNYFVEFRNFTGSDAQYSAETCDSVSCVGDVANQTGVRILRMEPSGFDDNGTIYSGFQGIPGYDTYLIGRTVGGVHKVKYQTGDTFWTKAGNTGVEIQIGAIDATTASVTVTRGTHTNNSDVAFVESTKYYDSTYRVGDTLTAFLGDDWDAEANTYQWRSRIHGTVAWTDIIGATSPSYVLTPNEYQQDVEVVITGTTPGKANAVQTAILGIFPGTLDPSDPGGYPIAVSKGVTLANDIGTVAIDNTSSTLQAVTTGFPSGTSFAYQWYRGSTAIAGAIGKAQTYTLSSADKGQSMKVSVVATTFNYTATSTRTSAARNLTITTSNTASALTISGSPQPGQTLTSNNGLNYIGEGAAFTPTGFSYQWLRSGVAIAGATDPTYLVQGADYGKKITVIVTASKVGWISSTLASATGPTINVPGVLVVNATPSILEAGLVKTVAASLGDVSAQGQATWLAEQMTYQWYRDNVAISGATKASYTLTTSDYGKRTSVRVVYSRAGYTAYSQYGVSAGTGNGTYWIKPSTSLPVLSGDVKTTNTLSIVPRTYQDMRDDQDITANITETYQWYRSGVAVTGATGTGPTYLLGTLDKGKAITVRVTATGTAGAYPYLLSSISTSAATPTVGTALLPNYTAAAPTLYVLGTSTAFVTTIGFTSAAGNGLTGITSPNSAANIVAYQWFRSGVAISGATRSTYALTQSDRDKDLSLRIVTSHVAIGSTTYTSDLRWTDAQNYTLVNSGTQELYSMSGPYAVGGQWAPSQPAYVDASTNVIFPVSRAYQWYRTGVAITGATGASYVIQAADAGKKITAKVTTGVAGLIPFIFTYATPNPADVVVGGTLVGVVNPVVTVSDPVTDTLSAGHDPVTGTVVAGSVSAVFAYQWLRNGASITGATKSAYKLTSADWGKSIKVRITASLAGYTSVLAESDPVDYSITLKAGHEPYESTGTFTLGSQVTLYLYDQFDTKDGTITDGTVTFQWLRAGVAITGATHESYILQAADYNKAVAVRFTVTKPGYIPLVFTQPYQTVGKGIELLAVDGYADPSVTVVPGTGNGTVRAQVNDIYPTAPTPVYTYKWYRGLVAISGATASTYKLTTLDTGQNISVKVTVSRANFVTPTFLLTSAGADHTIYAGTTQSTIAGTAAAGEQLTATPSDFYDDAAKTTAATGIDYVYTWYRDNVAIAGATTQLYTLTALDIGRHITVKATAVGPGRLAITGALSTATDKVIIGTIQVGTLTPAVAMNLTTRKATISFTGAAITPGVVGAYQWYRNNVAIAGATTWNYVLATTDTNKSISVVIKLTKAGFTTYLYAAAPGQLVNGFSQGEEVTVTGGTDLTTGAVGQTLLCIAPLYFLANGNELVYPTTGDPHPVGQNGTQSVQWTRDNAPIAGETGYSYTVLAGDSGHSISCSVTVGATLHKTYIDSGANTLAIS